MSFGALAGSLFSSAASLWGNVANNVLGANLQRSENKRAWNREYSLWQQQNAYNTPAAQMERLKAAGLNPMLVYGNGSVTGNTTQTASPRAQVVDYSGMGRSIGDAFSLLGERFLKSSAQQIQRDQLAFEREKWPAYREKLNQDVQLGQEQVKQARANSFLALARAAQAGAETDTVFHNLGIARDLAIRTGDYNPVTGLMVSASERGAQTSKAFGRKAAKWVDAVKQKFYHSDPSDWDRILDEFR